MGYEGNDKAALRNIENRENTKHMQTLLGICSGIIADNEINDQEIRFLSTWLSEYPSITDAWPGDAIADRVTDILRDGIITAEERTHLLETLKQITGNYFTETGSAQSEVLGIDFSDAEIKIYGMRFCFTGGFTFGTRERCHREIKKFGGVHVDNVSRALNYLVVGERISTQWIHMPYGRKIEQAMEYRNQYTQPDIISEQQWFQAIKRLATRN